MAIKARPLIRLSRRSYATLKSMSKETGKTMSHLAGDAIERYSRDRFWEEVNRAHDSWTPEQKREYRNEFHEWQALAGDTWPREDWEDERRAQKSAAATARRSVVDGSRSRSRSRAGTAKASSRRIR